MILLEFHSRVLAETIRQRIASQGKSYSKISLCDFDGCQYYVESDANTKTLTKVSISWPAYKDMKPFDVDNRLKAEYGQYAIPPSPGQDFTVQFDAEKLSDAEKNDLPNKIALLKRNVFASVFSAVFESLDGKGNTPDLVTVPYRKSEALYIKKSGKAAIIIFSINFADKDDIVYSDVFLKELVDTRKQISSAPSVMFSHKEAPLELKGVRGLYQGEDQGYVSFVLAPGAAGSERRQKTIDNIMLFRNYLMYHIKCAKAYLHTRMRLKTAFWLQVINRAKMKQSEGEKTTITGRTFARS